RPCRQSVPKAQRSGLCRSSDAKHCPERRSTCVRRSQPKVATPRRCIGVEPNVVVPLRRISSTRAIMKPLGEAQPKAASTYNAAADAYDAPANPFWDRFGRRTVERLQLESGARVLDVCCGSGASALAAAEIVGPEGSVVGVDLAEKLLQLARTKAADRGLKN